MIDELKVKNWYLCIKTANRYYLEGKLYKSEGIDCLTDEGGFTNHEWSIQKLNEHFIKLPELKLIVGKTYVCIRDVYVNGDPKNNLLYNAGVCYYCPAIDCLELDIEGQAMLRPWPSNKKGFYFKEIEL